MAGRQKGRLVTSKRRGQVSDKEREALRERRRAYYEQLSPEEKRAYREKRLRRRRQRQLRQMAISGGIMLALVIVAVIGTLIQQGLRKKPGSAAVSGTQAAGADQAFPGGTQGVTVPDWVTQDLIRINEHSRPGTTLEQVKGVVVHYVANPGTTAKQNRDYFDGLADSGATDASSHFVIDQDGSILQCVPLGEIAYASNERNADTISIECCHPDDTGEFTQATYDSLVRLVKWLEETYHLQPESVIRHYDVTGKICPKYFVEHEDAWTQFQQDIALK